MTKSIQWSDAQCAHYELTIEIKASRERLWRGLTDQLSDWWLPDFHMLGAESEVTLEPHAGGRLFEQNGDQHLLWYTVFCIQKYESLDLVGHINAKFGGPATTMLNVTLRNGTDGHTNLHLSDSLYGRVSSELVDALESGWRLLFSDGLKAFIETNP